ncbi:MAG: hypothetical protein WBP96_05670, partial [Nitrososphaeraceae archaeon]
TKFCFIISYKKSHAQPTTANRTVSTHSLPQYNYCQIITSYEMQVSHRASTYVYLLFLSKIINYLLVAPARKLK